MIQHHLLLVALFGILTLLTNAQNDFIVPQYNPCIGEEIVMSCYIDNTYYYSYTVYVSFGGSQAYSPSEINDNSISGFDTSRFQIDTISSANFSIKITNYEPQDSNTVFGCHGEFLANFTISGVLASGQLLTQAKPPSGLGTILSLSGIFNPQSCELQSTFFFSKPNSERTISTYKLYSNGKYDSILELDPYGDLVGSVYLTPGTSNTLQISAVSCGGESILSDSVTRSLSAYTLDNFLYLYLTQDNKLSISWSLTKTGTGTYDTENIGYSLQVLSKYTTDVVTQNVLNQSTTLNIISSKQQYLYDLGISKLRDSTVTLDITASLQIVSLCSLQITDGTVATDTQTGLTSTESILTTQQERGVLIAISVLFVVCAFTSGVQFVYILIEYNNKKRQNRQRYNALATTVLDNTNAGGPMDTSATAPPVYTFGVPVANPLQVQSTT